MQLTWSGISEWELNTRIDTEATDLPDDLKCRLEKIRVTPAFIQIKRSDMHGIERMFVIARLNGLAIAFDDVEDEFIVFAFPTSDGAVLEEWRLLGSLKFALYEVFKCAPGDAAAAP